MVVVALKGEVVGLLWDYEHEQVLEGSFGVHSKQLAGLA
jgi:hypothetical protein